MRAHGGQAVTGLVAYTRVWKDPSVGDRTWITVADFDGAGAREITRRPGRSSPWDDFAPVLFTPIRVAVTR